MTRIAIGFGLALAWALAACGGRDEAQQAREAREATQATVESAPQAGSPTGGAAPEDTEVTVDSAPTGEAPAEE
ncbi:MAG TPA: hypothetical protein VLC53_07115 [Myxococcota bacterium]|nr:hypothetical protein [Myxococcota bacterium]